MSRAESEKPFRWMLVGCLKGAERSSVARTVIRRANPENERWGREQGASHAESLEDLRSLHCVEEDALQGFEQSLTESSPKPLTAWGSSQECTSPLYSL